MILKYEIDIFLTLHKFFYINGSVYGLWKSFMYRIKRRGQRMDSCGIPATFFIIELISLRET